MGKKNNFFCTFKIFSFIFQFIYFNWKLITMLQFLPHSDMNQPWMYLCPSFRTPSPFSLPIPSLRVVQCTGFECPVSCMKRGLVIYFTHDNIDISMLFSQIIPPSPSPTESKSLLFISVSLLLSHIQGCCYHLSKFHIYALVYCIGVFLSDLLHVYPSVHCSTVYNSQDKEVTQISIGRRMDEKVVVHIHNGILLSY